VQREYNVIAVDPNHLELGIECNGTAIDPNTETITLATDHNLQSGDAVLYAPAPGNPNQVGGLTQGVIYYVLKVDEQSIKLVSTLDQALNPQNYRQNFTPSSVAGNSIAIGGNSFTAHQAVTYTAPAPV